MEEKQRRRCAEQSESGSLGSAAGVLEKHQGLGCLSKSNDPQRGIKKMIFIQPEHGRTHSPGIAVFVNTHTRTHALHTVPGHRWQESSRAMKCTEEENKTAAVGVETKQGGEREGGTAGGQTGKIKEEKP